MRTLKQIIVISFGLVSILCNKNPVNSDANIMMDIEGNIYKTVKIGNQTWMAENYRATKYNDGSTIPLVTNDSVWLTIFDTQTDACCLYNNTNNLDSIKRYGVLYNWNAVNKMNFAPIGWHVPSDSEWEILDKFLTEINASYFDTNGFSATLGGYRYYNGEFVRMGDCDRWWSHTQRGEQQAYCHLLCTSGKDVDDFTDKSAGLLVRLIKD